MTKIATFQTLSKLPEKLASSSDDFIVNVLALKNVCIKFHLKNISYILKIKMRNKISW